MLGSDLARSLRVFTGDKVTLIAPQGTVTPAGVVPRLKSFRVVGIFEVGMYEYDSGLALINLEDAQRLYQMGDGVTGVRLKVDDLFQAPRIARELVKYIDADAYLHDWTKSHANFFRAVQIEKNMMFIILSLIVAVAAFNLVSTLVMAVTDKQADIAILRTLGARPLSIMAVFVVQGALVGFIGLGLGIVGGVALALNIDVVVPFIERMLGVHFLSKEVYYISDLPSDLQWGDVWGVTLIAFVLALLADPVTPVGGLPASIRRRRCAMSEPILIARGVSKVFRGGGLEVPVLTDIDLAVAAGRDHRHRRRFRFRQEHAAAPARRAGQALGRRGDADGAGVFGPERGTARRLAQPPSRFRFTSFTICCPSSRRSKTSPCRC